jgi:MFS family permease
MRRSNILAKIVGAVVGVIVFWAIFIVFYIIVMSQKPGPDDMGGGWLVYMAYMATPLALIIGAWIGGRLSDRNSRM